MNRQVDNERAESRVGRQALDADVQPLARRILRTPLYFAAGDRSLFGWHHAPAVGPTYDLAVVICPPLGHEYVNSHRSLRHLADRFAAAGVRTLRFDYEGTGDSPGTDEEPARLAAWLASVHAAIRVLRERSGCSQIALVGLRMGATLAALAARDAEISSLVLWAPCARGRSYVREMRALQLTGSNTVRESTDIEAGGFVITEQTQRDIGGIDLEEVLPQTKRVLIVSRDDFPEDTRLRDKWREARLDVETQSFSGYVDMFAPPHNTIVPHAAIEKIISWVVADTKVTESVRREGKDEAVMLDTREGIRESIVYENSVFGILSEPLSGAKKFPAVLLPNAGATHHVGPNRLYILLARELSRAGFPCLRFDLPGLGDNVIPDLERENDPYPPAASEAVTHALSAMQRRSATSSVLMGLCSGAHTSFHATVALKESAIVEGVLINPLTFYYKSGMSLDQPDSNHYKQWQRYMRSMRSLRGWAKLFREDTRFFEIFKNILERLRAIIASRVRGLRQKFFGRPNNDTGENRLTDDLRGILAANRKLTFVFSRFDPGYDLLMINAGGVVKRSLRSGQVALWQINGANHTFEEKLPRGEMIQSVKQHLLSRYSR